MVFHLKKICCEICQLRPGKPGKMNNMGQEKPGKSKNIARKTRKKISEVARNPGEYGNNFSSNFHRKLSVSNLLLNTISNLSKFQ